MVVAVKSTDSRGGWTCFGDGYSLFKSPFPAYLQGSCKYWQIAVLQLNEMTLNEMTVTDVANIYKTLALCQALDHSFIFTIILRGSYACYFI